MNAMKKPVIVVGSVGGYALFLWSVYRLFNAKIMNAASFLLLVLGIALVVLGVKFYISGKNEYKQVLKQNASAKDAFVEGVDKLLAFVTRCRPVFIMLLVASVFACMHPRFLPGTNWLNILKQNSHYGVLAAGVCFAILLGFLKYMAKVPRMVTGDYEPEPEVANAPDNGEPMAPKDGIDKLFDKIFGNKEAAEA